MIALVKIKKQLISSRAITSGNGNAKKYITIHQTANTSKGANAQAHANLQSNGNSRSASWHWTVDDKQAIQSFPHNVKCWHAGNSIGNNQSIGIELCVNSDANYKKVIENAAELVKKIMKEENISIMNVKQHNHWSGKNCPAQLRAGKDGISWNGFIDMIKGKEVKPNKPQVKPKPSKPSNKYNVAVDGSWGPDLTRNLQRYFGTTVDGVISGQPKNRSTQNIPSAKYGTSGSNLIRAMQRYYGCKIVDGKISNPSNLIKTMQLKYNLKIVDGHVSLPSNLVKEIQRRLNKGTL